MKEMLKNYKGKLILSSLVTLLPLFAGILFWREALILSGSFLAAHLLCLFFVFHDKKNRNQSKKALGLVFWLCPMMSLFCTACTYMALSETDASYVLMTLMCFGFGLLFVVCGNYFPKFRQNSTMGIRIKWTLQNEENWNATHRLGGKVWVVCGLFMMVCGFFASIRLSDSFSLFLSAAVFPLLIVAAVLIPCIYSYVYYKRQVRDGKVEKNGRTKPKSAALTIGILCAVALYLFYVLFTGNMEIAYGDTSFTIETGNWEDLTISYEEIEEITYFDQDPSHSVSGTRTNGFGNFKMSLGSFYNELYGNYTRYSFVDCDACVVLKVNGETVVLNGPDAESTKEIYDRLLGRVK